MPRISANAGKGQAAARGIALDGGGLNALIADQSNHNKWET